jgi:hypothetical protein
MVSDDEASNKSCALEGNEKTVRHQFRDSVY